MMVLSQPLDTFVMKPTLISHAHTRFSVSGPIDPRPVSTDFSPSQAYVSDPPSRRFAAAKGIARAARDAITSCGSFIKGLALKVGRLLACRSGATPPRASAQAHSANRGEASTETRPAQRLGRSHSMPDLGAARAKTAALLTKKGPMVSTEVQTTPNKPPRNMVSMGMQTMEEVPKQVSQATMSTQTVTLPSIAAEKPRPSMVSMGTQTVGEVPKQVSQATMSTQTDILASSVKGRTSRAGSQTSVTKSAVGSQPTTPGSAKASVATGVTGTPAPVRGGPAAPPPPPPVATLQADRPDPLAALRAAVQNRDTVAAKPSAKTPAAGKPGSDDLIAQLQNSPAFKNMLASIEADEAAREQAANAKAA